MKRYGETVGAGSTFVEVSGKKMSDMRLMMPKSIEEQKAIATQVETLLTITAQVEKSLS